MTYTDPYIFYHIMRYPLPPVPERFAMGNAHNIPPTSHHNTKGSYKYPEYVKGGDAGVTSHAHYTTPMLQPYIETIRKWQRLRTWCPYVESVYICNSLSFGAVHESSDIDVCILTTPHRTWLCRLHVLFVFRFFNLLITPKRKRLKFCPSFFLSYERANLQDIALKPYDVYLTYRIAHAQCIYDTKNNTQRLYHANPWIHTLLPTYTPSSHGMLPIRVSHSQSIYKRIVHRATGGWIGAFQEWLLTAIWLPIIMAKQRRTPESHRGCLAGPDILKFHRDIRKRVNALYKLTQTHSPSSQGTEMRHSWDASSPYDT